MITCKNELMVQKQTWRTYKTIFPWKEASDIGSRTEHASPAALQVRPGVPDEDSECNLSTFGDSRTFLKVLC